MSTFGATPPSGVRLSPFSQRVFDIIRSYTAFPWPVLLAQCNRRDLDATHLTPETLASVIDDIARGVARFTSPEKGEAVRGALRTLKSR